MSRFIDTFLTKRLLKRIVDKIKCDERNKLFSRILAENLNQNKYEKTTSSIIDYIEDLQEKSAKLARLEQAFLEETLTKKYTQSHT